MGGRNRRQLALAACAISISTALAGCGGGAPSPETSGASTASGVTGTPSAEVTSPEPTDEPTPEPSETLDPWRLGPPGVSMNMRYDTEQGAQEFVEYYIQTYNYANATQDTEQLDQISHLNCVGCQSALDSIQAIAADGLTLQDGGTTISSIDGVSHDVDDTIYIVNATLADAPGSLVNTSGEVVQVAEGLQYETTFIARYLGPMEWTMIAFGGSVE